ncbi:MAG: hypothetical protein P4K93_15555 [Terracidiphilus sp.]|nr:hypothetical protein [Terracidiphilus sp.]MDR3799575.1 hypothetical protein [Terracidiphilus sp.]
MLPEVSPAPSANPSASPPPPPIGDFVTEFPPGVACHVHVQVVIIQRITNQLARTDNTAQ